jgi:hypothetical protein
MSATIRFIPPLSALRLRLVLTGKLKQRLECERIFDQYRHLAVLLRALPHFFRIHDISVRVLCPPTLAERGKLMANARLEIKPLSG